MSSALAKRQTISTAIQSASQVFSSLIIFPDTNDNSTFEPSKNRKSRIIHILVHGTLGQELLHTAVLVQEGSGEFVPMKTTCTAANLAFCLVKLNSVQA